MKKILYRGNFSNFVVKNNYEYIERNNCKGIVVIFPITEDKKIVLVEQFRIPVRKRMIELPAGLARDTLEFKGETLKQAAQRELLEETGFRAGSLKLMGKWAPAPGLCSEMLTIYFASKLKKIEKGGGDENENITVHTVPLKKLSSFLKKKRDHNILVDIKIYAATYWYLTEKAF